MSKNSYDATGVLVLDAVTPVIRALFGGFKLEDRSTQVGQVRITRPTELNQPFWEDVNLALVELCDDLGLEINGGTESIEECLSVLATQFGVDKDETLIGIIKRSKFFNGEVNLKLLFDIAVRLNDGHGLKSLKLEGGWHSNRPDLSEFGGSGQFVSNEYAQTCSSNDVIAFGEKLQPKLASGDVKECAELVLDEVTSIFSGIRDARQRAEVKRHFCLLFSGYVPF